MIVIKKDNNRETYDRAKIEGGVFRACHKRPVSATQIEAMIDDVESSIFSKEEREISSRQIGEMVMEKLKTWILWLMSGLLLCTESSKM